MYVLPANEIQLQMQFLFSCIIALKVFGWKLQWQRPKHLVVRFVLHRHLPAKTVIQDKKDCFQNVSHSETQL